MKALGGVILALLLLSGCSTIRNYQAADAYNAQMASNVTEYENGQIPLSEKLRRDYLAGMQYGQINKAEASCLSSYSNLAMKYERGRISEQRFNDRRNSLEVACTKAYFNGNDAPISMWIVAGAYSGE